jgi:restriction endonuclease S subunit
MKKLHRVLKVEEFSKVFPGAARSLYVQEASQELQKVYLLKGINLDQDGGITTNEMEEVYLSPNKNSDRYLLKSGDVVIMARGSAIRVSLVDTDVEQKNVIASGNLLIIRPNIDKVQSEVIVAYLRSIVGQASLLSLSQGAAIQHIPTSKLRALEVPVPLRAKQIQIANIFHASKEAYQATIALAEQQKKTASTSMLSLMIETTL